MRRAQDDRVDLAIGKRVTQLGSEREPLLARERRSKRARVDALDRPDLGASLQELHDDAAPPAEPDDRHPYHPRSS
jgi:hypothetical protein